MKKSLVALALILSAVTVDAASYRGFFDLFGGVCTGGKTTVKAGDLSISNIKNDLAFGFNMTHGCQITPFLYAGAGFGAFSTLMSATDEQPSYSWDDYDGKSIKITSMDIPIYLDIRYDLNIRKKVTPFVDLKFGYRINVDFSADDWTSSSYSQSEINNMATVSELSVQAGGESGFYFQPSVGVRFRMGKKSGFNLGVTYDTTVSRKLVGSYNSRKYGMYGDVSEETITSGPDQLKKLKEGAIMLQLGFDF